MSHFRDWFGRDADYGYTYYNPKKRSVNWDKGYTNYSDFIFGYSTDKIKIEEAAQLLTTMSRVMGVNTSKFSARKSSDSVHIPAEMLKDSAKLDAFLGASLQNMAAFIHQDHDERLKDRQLGKGQVSINKLVAKILNQERIGKRMADETPGYLRFVQKYKEEMYSKRPVATDDTQHLLELFDRIIRYPENINDEELEKFKEPISQIKSILQKSGGIPDEFTDMLKLSRKVSNVLCEYINEFEKKDSDSSKDGVDGDDDSEPKDSKKPKPSESSKTKDFIAEIMQNLEGGAEGEGSASSFEQLMDAIRSDQDVNSKITSKVDYIPVKSDKRAEENYKAAIESFDVASANVLGSLLRRKSRDYQFQLKSMRSGRLDTSKLAEAVQGVSTIYERIGQVKTNKLCVTILVDESGSMHGRKADAARQAAIFMNEALKSVPDVELFIYGHTADLHHRTNELSKSPTGSMSTQLLIYKEPGVNNGYQLGHISGRYENRDGVAMIAAAKRVRNFTPNNGVFIVISDGSPHAHSYCGDSARTHVRKMANSIEQMGFQVIQVTIGGYHSSDMFKTVVDMDDVSTFPRQFVNFLKRKINTMIKEKVTL